MSSTRNRRSAAAPQQQSAAAELRRAARNAQHRATLGLLAGEALPAQLGTVGGSRGGHSGRRINQSTTGQPALWHTVARRRAAAGTQNVQGLDGGTSGGARVSRAGPGSRPHWAASRGPAAGALYRR